MGDRSRIVLDVGKTNAKITLWNSDGSCLARRVRANHVAAAGEWPTLDVKGVEPWVKDSLRAFATMGPIASVATVAHGAAAALVHQGQLFAPPMDYEVSIPPHEMARYDAQRGAFAETGSPRLPQGLNLGAQLSWLETLTGPWPDDLKILLWPQYWAWRFSGVMASEVTSLGCHTDLWVPAEGRTSALANTRGWANRLPPLRRAGDILGPVTEEWVRDTGLPADCEVMCGLHDSNAALVAARGHSELVGGDATIVSTGTWFVAMRSMGRECDLQLLPALSSAQDCLINVDIAGSPAPSARFMGGREAEVILGLNNSPLKSDPAALEAAALAVIEDGVMLLPTFAPGFGPFPKGRGGWVSEPVDPLARAAAVGLYLALVTDVSLDLIGAKGPILLEGRFAGAETFVRALACLREGATVYVTDADDDVSFGALRVLEPHLTAKSKLTPVNPLSASLGMYRTDWRARIARYGR